MPAVFVYNDQLSQHVLRDDHPLKPYRLRLTYQLLEGYRAFGHPEARLVAPRPATEAELCLVHDPDYVAAVRRISDGAFGPEMQRYGFSPAGDNPPFPGMYEASLLSTGASLTAAEALLSGEARVAFSISGGLHHAARDHASGFCIFNDPAVAIAWLVQRGLRVVYVDIDAHHGDGVQNAFYDSDQVLTISFHESGRYLFPGTGDVSELGSGSGAGYSVNLPLFPYTDDETYRQAFDQVVPPLLNAFAPDVLVLQLGVDAHFRDPLAHLQLSTETYQRIVRWLLTAAPKVLALGGGGYDVPTVARAWALEYGLMLGLEWPEETPPEFARSTGHPHLHDQRAPEPDPRSAEMVRQFAQESVAEVRRQIFPVHKI